LNKRRRWKAKHRRQRRKNLQQLLDCPPLLGTSTFREVLRATSPHVLNRRMEMMFPSWLDRTREPSRGPRA
jgi:hypothetical protein